MYKTRGGLTRGREAREPGKRKHEGEDASVHSSGSFDSLKYGSRRHEKVDSMTHDWHKASKVRGKFSEKIIWDGTGEKFTAFKRGVEGHLLQTGAGYLVHEHFLYHYMEDSTACQRASTYFNDNPIWLYHEQSCYQIRYDKEYLYGLLVMAMRDVSNKTLLKHQHDRDGIKAWADLRRDFEYGGSAKLRLEVLDSYIHQPYVGGSPEGLPGYLDKLMASFSEAEIIQEEDYTERFKKRTLLTNIRGLLGAAHLVQNCRDHEE